MTCTSTSDTTRQAKSYIGIDTETYYDEGCKGLKSIQIYGMIDGKIQERYILPSTFETTDHLIRMEMARKFFDFFEEMTLDTEVAFFNIDFDISQVLYFMTNNAGYDIRHIGDDRRFMVKKGEMSILESDRNMYSITFRTRKHGRLIRMIDLYNFLPATTLNSSCEAWLGDKKVEIETKKFPKQFPSEIEKEYAMKDAELTYRLFMALKEGGIIEGSKYVTIAGRTLGHFKGYLKENYGLTIDQYFFSTDNNDLIDEWKREIE